MPDEGLVERDVVVASGLIEACSPDPVPQDRFNDSQCLEATGLTVLPGMIDIHGDAFERQLMPRPGVNVPVDVALLDTDRQMLASGITTAMHGVTYSWEPGLRGRDRSVEMVEAVSRGRNRGTLGCDTHIHLRIETYNVEADEDMQRWLRQGQLGVLAFNNHTTSILRHLDEGRQNKLQAYEHRTGLSSEAFADLLESVRAREPQVDGFVRTLTELAREYRTPMLSHDDDTPELRQYYHDQGCEIAEFPINEATARFARDSLGNQVVLGAPNVMRGGSHNGSVDAAQMVRAGICSILASDYYYPAMLQAVFRLVREGAGTLAELWNLVSANPARSLGMNDRGQLSEGQRADLLLIDASDLSAPRLVATIAGGRLFMFGENRLN